MRKKTTETEKTTIKTILKNPIQTKAVTLLLFIKLFVFLKNMKKKKYLREKVIQP